VIAPVRSGDRKYTVAMVILIVGGVLCLMTLALAAFHSLTPEAVQVLEAFAKMVSYVGVGFMGGNALEHWSKKGKPESEDTV